MQVPEDNMEAAEVTRAILSILLKAFPARVGVYDTDVADIIGLNYETTMQSDGSTTITYDDLASGATLEDVTNGVLAWFSLEGLTHHGEEDWADVVLSAKALKALDVYPSYLPAI